MFAPLPAHQIAHDVLDVDAIVPTTVFGDSGDDDAITLYTAQFVTPGVLKQFKDRAMVVRAC